MSTLPVAVDLLINGAWTDITADAYRRDIITITRGQTPQATTADPARCALSLRNKNGRYSPRNPMSPYYGLIGRNTQLRVSAMAGVPYLGATDAYTPAARVSTPDTAALDITGDLDLRFDITPTTWSDPTGTYLVEIAGKWGAAGQRSWNFQLYGGELFLVFSPDGTTSLFAGSILDIAPAGGRLCVRATLQVNNGAGGWTVNFYTAPSMSGPWTLLGTPQIGTGTTSIFNSTAALEIGDVTTLGGLNAACRIHAAEIRNGIGGTVVANPQFTAQPAGTLTFTDAAGRPWTANSATAITNRQIRGVFEVSEWPARWEASGADVWVPLVCAGPKRRIGSGQTPLYSPMRRDITSPARTAVVAYWPMEDGAQAVTLASAMPRGTPMTTIGTISPAADATWVASEPLPTLGTGVVVGTVPPYTSTGTIYTRLYVAVPLAGLGSTQKILTVNTAGSAATWTLYGDSTGKIILRAQAADSTVLYDSGAIGFALNGARIVLYLRLVQSGANVNWGMGAINVANSTLGNFLEGGLSGTLTGATIGRATSVRVGEGGGLGGTVVGHLSVANDANAYNGSYGPLIGWSGETAIDRINRLCTEEGIAVSTVGSVASSTLVGPQGIDTILNLLQAAADADGGYLGEQRELLGLRYIGRSALFNQPPALVLDYTQPGLAPPLEPTDDTQNVVNDITISRTGGSGTRVTQDTGTLSTLAPPAGIGRYPTSTDLNLYTDAQAGDAAGWLLHVATWDESRYPAVPVNMRRLSAAQVTAASLLETGGGLQITHLPAWTASSTVSQLVQGYTERIGYTWDVVFGCVPAGPYTVGILDDPVLGRADTDGSTLASAISSTATAVSLATTTSSSPPWTVDHSQTPFDVMMGGEQVTLGCAGQQLVANPWLTAGLTGWTASNSTAAVDSTYLYGPATSSALITPNGTSASGGLNSALTGAGTVTPAATYTVMCWCYAPTAWADVRACIDWYNAAGTFLSTSLGSATAIAAGTWTFLSQSLTAPASASQGVARFRWGSTPASTVQFWLYGQRMVPDATVSAASPQTFTVVRSVNGIVKAQAAGTDVRLAQPLILSL